MVVNKCQKEKEGYEKLLYKNLKNYYFDELGLRDYEERIRKRLKREVGKELINKIKNYYSIEGKKVLEVGSGWGEICVEVAKCGAVVTGVEPDKELLKISKLLGKVEEVDVNFVEGCGENLPFDSNCFDLLICHAVLEHVTDVSKTISELVRVAKHGGIIYLKVPNYLMPYEDHYKIFYPPMFPKSLVRIYLKFRGKKSDFINHINYTTSFNILSEFKKYNVKIKNVSNDKHYPVKSKNTIKKILKRILIMINLPLKIELFIEKIS